MTKENRSCYLLLLAVLLGCGSCRDYQEEYHFYQELSQEYEDKMDLAQSNIEESIDLIQDAIYTGDELSLDNAIDILEGIDLNHK